MVHPVLVPQIGTWRLMSPTSMLSFLRPGGTRAVPIVPIPVIDIYLVYFINEFLIDANSSFI